MHIIRRTEEELEEDLRKVLQVSCKFILMSSILIMNIMRCLCSDCKETKIYQVAKDDVKAKWLWTVSEKWTRIAT